MSAERVSNLEGVLVAVIKGDFLDGKGRRVAIFLYLPSAIFDYFFLLREGERTKIN